VSEFALTSGTTRIGAGDALTSRSTSEVPTSLRGGYPTVSRGILLQAGVLALTLSSLSGGADPWASIQQRYVGTTQRDVFEPTARRRRITLAEAVKLCDEIQREAELRRQEAVDREAQAWLEDGILG